MHYILFTTTRCPKCPEFKKFVINHLNINGYILDETNDNFVELTEKYHISSAPTIIIFDDAENQLFRGDETYDLEEFIKNTNNH